MVVEGAIRYPCVGDIDGGHQARVGGLEDGQWVRVGRYQVGMGTKKIVVTTFTNFNCVMKLTFLSQ